jgi:hypothetical protein
MPVRTSVVVALILVCCGDGAVWANRPSFRVEPTASSRSPRGRGERPTRWRAVSCDHDEAFAQLDGLTLDINRFYFPPLVTFGGNTRSRRPQLARP